VPQLRKASLSTLDALLDIPQCRLGYERVPNDRGQKQAGARPPGGATTLIVFPVSRRAAGAPGVFLFATRRETGEFDRWPAKRSPRSEIRTVASTPRYCPLADALRPRCTDGLEPCSAPKPRTSLLDRRARPRGCGRPDGLACARPASLLDYCPPTLIAIDGLRSHCRAHADWFDDHAETITDAEVSVLRCIVRRRAWRSRAFAVSISPTARERPPSNSFESAAGPCPAHPNQSAVGGAVRATSRQKASGLAGVQPRPAARASASKSTTASPASLPNSTISPSDRARRSTSNTPVAPEDQGQRQSLKCLQLRPGKLVLLTDREFFRPQSLGTSLTCAAAQGGTASVDPGKMRARRFRGATATTASAAL